MEKEDKKIEPKIEGLREHKAFQKLETAWQTERQNEKKDLFLQLGWLQKMEWDALGKEISRVEHHQQLPEEKLRYDKIITLRLDGANFSSLVARLRKMGVLESEGMSTRFSEIMAQVAKSLHVRFHALLTHNHSDEITMILQPLASSKSEHPHGGKHDKLVSLSASLASSCFAQHVAALAQKLSLTFPPQDKELHIQFDCRMGVWDSLSEALALVWWRSRDALVNGLTDTTHHNRTLLGILKKDLQGLSSKKKLKLLEEKKIQLPLDRILGCTTLNVKEKRMGFNPKTQKQTGEQERTKQIQVHASLLQCFQMHAPFLLK